MLAHSKLIRTSLDALATDARFIQRETPLGLIASDIQTRPAAATLRWPCWTLSHRTDEPYSVHCTAAPRHRIILARKVAKARGTTVGTRWPVRRKVVYVRLPAVFT